MSERPLKVPLPVWKKIRDQVLAQASEAQDDDLARVFDLVKDALVTDGEAHKQWFLVEILKTLDPRAHSDYIRWVGDEGTPP